MKISLKQFGLGLMAILGLSQIAIGLEHDYKKFYISAEGGYSKPIKKKFTHLESGTIGNLTGSKVYEGKIGYMFYENIALEFSYAYRPNYKLALDIKDQALYKDIHPKAKVKSYAMVANLVYYAQPYNRITPYFSAGIGYARVTPQKTTIYANIPALGLKDQNVGEILKQRTERIAYRLGAGANITMSDNLALTFGGKIEIVNNIALPTRFINILTKQEVERKTIKKTIGVAEFTGGLRFSF